MKPKSKRPISTRICRKSKRAECFECFQKDCKIEGQRRALEDVEANKSILLQSGIDKSTMLDVLGRALEIAQTDIEKNRWMYQQLHYRKEALIVERNEVAFPFWDNPISWLWRWFYGTKSKDLA